MLPLLVGCNQSAGNVPLAREMPAAPAFLRPVEVSEPREGEREIVVAARERAGRQQANAIIVQAREWIERVRKSYGRAR